MKPIKDADKIIERFEKDWESMSDYWSKLHQEWRKDMKFIWFNKQWDKEAEAERTRPLSVNGSAVPPRPCLVFNILKPFIIKVCNGIKKLRMGIKVNPVDNGTDKELAEVRRGIHRAIERNTEAESARDNATNGAVSAGYGFYGFVTEPEDPKSFDHEIKYRTVKDATNVLWDDDDKTEDGSGLKKFILQEIYGVKEFETEFDVDWTSMSGSEKQLSGAWGTQNKPIVSEYWYIDEKKETLVMVDGVNMYLSEAKEKFKDEALPIESFLDADEETGEIYERETHSREVWVCKLAGRRVLSKDKWKGYWIPWFKIEGRFELVDGDVIKSGLGRDAKPSQQTYNYARNNQIERMGQANKIPMYVPVDGIPEAEKIKYETANSRNWDHLKFNAYDEQGRPIPGPQKPPPAQIEPAFANEAGTSRDEIMATMGLYGSYTGDTQNEKSGKAILAGAQESADIVYDFSNNKVKVMKHEGRVREEMIPKVYDTARQVRMVGEDDKEKVIMVNQKARDEKGREYYYDMKVGKFDIKIDMGPSDEDKRLETLQGLEGLRSVIPPQAFAAMADIFVGEQSFRRSDEAEARLKRWIELNMPGIIEDKDGPSPEVKQMQAQMKQMEQQAMQVIQQLKTENDQLKAKTELEKAKILVNAEIEKAKLEEQKQVNEENNEVDVFKAETDRIKVEGDNASKVGQNRLNAVKTMTDISKPERRYT